MRLGSPVLVLGQGAPHGLLHVAGRLLGLGLQVLSNGGGALARLAGALLQVLAGVLSALADVAAGLLGGTYGKEGW